jgi:anaerobic ribonucleoside-triphosphate reductase
MDILKAVANAIKILHRQDNKLLAFEEKMDRQNKELLETVWYREKVKEMVLQRMNLGGRHLFNSKQLEFLTECDCHRGTNISTNTHFTSFIYIN